MPDDAVLDCKVKLLLTPSYVSVCTFLSSGAEGEYWPTFPPTLSGPCMWGAIKFIFSEKQQQDKVLLFVSICSFASAQLPILATCVCN